MNVKIIIVYIVILIVLFGPMMYSNSKKKKKYDDMISNLAIGKNIITVGGIYGSIVKIEDTFFEIKVDKGVSIKIAKSAISKVIEG